ncbi:MULTISPECIES: carbamoyltransferase HypF [unclassified Methanoregula]|uniref:carbamoyltransferase HypF n=1 Tax=unclassified Methanoregula TaxID=2649730 RepID=UPI0009D1FFD7|nr:MULTISPECIES: carbamoyltransferase HypF [unclassified Methanoregula]OPX64081.1 MAG: Acylphosphatase [Methanoregula sp. PtaB.Bin085]OPY34799.1 MAG: Acylphosphatase [Methanoregula sp. PtaU1.Bin006]
MQKTGRITVRGIVQGVGFRPFVYAQACDLGISGSVKNLGSEVEIYARGERFEEFVGAVSRGPALARIDSVEVTGTIQEIPDGFFILRSGTGSFTGMIPPDIAICSDCIADIFRKGGRYHDYWATSCVNCGPRYSIISEIPYDRERTSMADFPMCNACAVEYSDPHSRRHHAQTIACDACGPDLSLSDRAGNRVTCHDPVKEAASLLDNGSILAIRGIGGFHLACIEKSAATLKQRLGRIEQPFAIMVRPDFIENLAIVTPEEKRLLESPIHPIVVLEKRDHSAHAEISNIHTIGCMFPYTGLHHLIFSHLKHPLLIMTSANMPGYPMITDTDVAMAKLNHDADFFLVHNRRIVNRCDDSVMRDGFIIRLSRGIAPKRTAIDLGNRCILGVGPELNANATIYRGGFAVTSPHVGNVRNPPTLAYLEETVKNLQRILGAKFDVIAHDLHPSFLSTRFARELAAEHSLELVPVQHHRAHIAAATTGPCVGIAIDGVGYGDDGTIWGGEIFCGQVPGLQRVAHLEPVPMPGGDLATRFPERMLYGILPEEEILALLASRGWPDVDLGVLRKQVATGFNVPTTTSTGRVLDAASALLGICKERTYDGEPAMKLESAAAGAAPEPWELTFSSLDGCEVLSTRALMRTALVKLKDANPKDRRHVKSIASSFQYNLARGIAAMAVRVAGQQGMKNVALSGGVAYNHQIRETIRQEIAKSGLNCIINADYPLGDGCVSYGQCVYAGAVLKGRRE